MKKSIFFIMTVLTVVTLVFSISYCEEVVELTFWHHEAPAHRVAAFQEVIDLFEAEHPNIKVTQEVVMWGDAWIKTIAAIEAGSGPDFQFSIPDLLLTSYLLDALLPVTDIVEELDKEYDFIDSMIAP